MCSPTPPPDAVEWLRDGDRRVFSLAPFRVHKSLTVDGVRRGALVRCEPDAVVIVSAWNGAARVSRHRGTAAALERRAVDEARRTGDPVVIGRQVGVDGDGLPLWESVGRIVTAKADPFTPEAFEDWTSSLARRLGTASRADLRAMGLEALEHLDFDFRGVSVRDLERGLAGYRGNIATPKGTMLRAQQLELTRGLRPVLRGSARAASRMPDVRARLAAGFRLQDRRIARSMAKDLPFWVRNRHGAISRTMSDRARGIIANGLRDGLGRREIGRQLAEMTGRGLRQPGYYQTVAANAVARARSYASGSSYRAAGIEFYRIEAVLDDRTTHQCEFLHGKVLPVEAGMRRADAALRDPNPESVMWNQPMMSDAGDHLAIDFPDGSSTRVADITERSTGATPRGVSARFDNAISQTDMVDAAIGYPPYHHGCRTVTVPA
jgi:hypothetical protein